MRAGTTDAGPGGRRRSGAVLPAFSALAVLAGSPAAGQSPGEIRVDTIPGSEIAVAMAWIPAGTFPMGSPEGEPGRDPDEGPVHTVSLTGFWMGIHEVSVEAYGPFRYRLLDDVDGVEGPGTFNADAVTRPSPPYEDPTHGMGSGTRPATGVTRWNALHYARWLSEKTGRLYRLPTEAEWEYACRAGSDAPWGFGGDAAEAPTHAWLHGNSGGRTHPAGGKAANAWGLHDMHGNVAEWVMDGYAQDTYRDRAAGAAVASPRAGHPWRGRGVVRGGTFDDDPADARCAERLPENAAWKRRDPQIPKSSWWNTDSPHVGFRLVSPAGDFTPDEIRAYWNEILGG